MSDAVFKVIGSPLGNITLAGDGEALSGLWFENQRFYRATLAPNARECMEKDAFEAAIRWLNEYFAGRMPDFMPALYPQGSDFRRAVWRELMKIPYGQTTTYGRIAQNMGLARAGARAVGGAVGHNPISVMIPCHRVLGAGGSLTGYAGGLERKRFLLALEGAHVSGTI